MSMIKMQEKCRSSKLIVKPDKGAKAKVKAAAKLVQSR